MPDDPIPEDDDAVTTDGDAVTADGDAAPADDGGADAVAVSPEEALAHDPADVGGERVDAEDVGDAVATGDDGADAVAVSPEEALAQDPAQAGETELEAVGAEAEPDGGELDGGELGDGELGDGELGGGGADPAGTRDQAGARGGVEAGARPDLAAAVEAVVMVADSPVAPSVLAQVVDAPQAAVERALVDLAAGYRAQRRGFELVEVAGGWRFQSHPDQAAYVERFVLEGQTAKLSAAALETLAIIAYKQPISRAQVAAIRGVSVDGVVRTLEQRGYIGEVARDPGPGQAVLFGTTPLFLDKLGLASLADLPAIADFVPGADVVEALEHGLRVESAEPDPEASPERPSDLPASGDASGAEAAPPPPGGERPTLGDLLDGDG